MLVIGDTNEWSLTLRADGRGSMVLLVGSRGHFGRANDRLRSIWQVDEWSLTLSNDARRVMVGLVRSRRSLC